MGMEAVPTPAAHVRELLARVRNPFDVSDSVLARLDEALLVHVELHGWRQRKAPAPSLRCSSHRHVFLLPDGELVALWELSYDSAEDGSGGNGSGLRVLHEVYESEEALVRSEHRVQEAHRTAGRGPRGRRRGGAADVPVELLLTTGHPFGRRTYRETGSPDHARRLLRRAENADSPGQEIAALLETARGHEILPVPKPQVLAHEWQVWCTVYEHAFLLADGSELSLYEVEHDLSGSGALVCEVYLEEGFADRAVNRLVRDRGFGA
ncbi:DUF6227 family protein [Streptomyces nanshensis]|uniref:Uncharacterized protein n=1 Tax=Streptomyces nanshensis TaxID=518642 RepID=A0A1E7KGR9_9ACTN|nr:DUF6227 family protein [Streptomyces nanshensis]OEV03073.1 hypothetical protein AN218_32810 [Streptomyces nanshensis]